MVKFTKSGKNKKTSTISKVKKVIKAGAKLYLKARRSKMGKSYFKGGMVSTTAVAKSLTNLNRKMLVSAELKTLDQNHTTGSPDVALRQFFRLQASLNEATPSTTTTLGTIGFLTRQINYPSQGDAMNQYDGQKFSVESIQWKGTLNLANNASGADCFVKLFIVKYKDAVDSGFSITEFLQVDENGEISTKSRRARDTYKDYQVVAYRQYRLTYGNRTRQDFNIFATPKTIVRHDDTGTSNIQERFYCVAVVSGDIADKVSQVDYAGFTRMRFIH